MRVSIHTGRYFRMTTAFLARTIGDIEDVSNVRPRQLENRECNHLFRFVCPRHEGTAQLLRTPR